MCPISCRAIESNSPTAKTRTPSVYSSQDGIGGAAPLVRAGAARAAVGVAADQCRRGQLASAPPGPVLCLFDVLDGTRVPAVGAGVAPFAQPLLDHLADGVHDLQEADVPVVERPDQLLVGRVVDRRGAARRPRPPAGRARRPGTRRRRAARRSRCWRCVQSTCAAAPGTRSGQPMASAIGSRMSGGEAWAMVEPSTNSTMEWITDCGWTTTSMRSNGMSNSRCASMTSRPLLTSVAELVVISRPMSQVGCARACCGVTAVSSSRRRPRNGPPLAVTSNRRTSTSAAGAQALGQRGVLGVDRDELARRGQPRDDRAAGDQRLLVRQPDLGAGLQGGDRGPQPLRAVHGVEHEVAAQRGHLGGGTGAGVDRGRRRVRGPLRVEALAQLVGRRLLAHRDVCDPQLRRLGGEQLEVAAAGGQGGDPEAVGRAGRRRRSSASRSSRSSRAGRCRGVHPCRPSCQPRPCPPGGRSGERRLQANGVV